MPSEFAPRHDLPSYTGRPTVYEFNLEGFEREGEASLPFLPSYREVKLLGIAEVCPFLYRCLIPMFISSPSLA